MKKEVEYKIGDFSKISRISVKTLRYYHEIGLLSPSRIDVDSGYRFYCATCFNDASRINFLKSLNFSLKEIKEIIDKYSDDDDLTLVLKQKLDETKDKIKQYQSVEKSLEKMIPNRKEQKYNSGVDIKDVPDIIIASIRTVDMYHNIGGYMDKIIRQCSRLICGQPFSLYYDSEYNEEGVDMEICFPVREQITSLDINSRILKGGKFISVIHKGGYGEIGNAYKKNIDYCYKNNIETILPSREIYIKGPGMVFMGNPQKYITEVQLQMKG